MDKNQDSKRKLTEENKDLPGYPHYPPDEDIMNPQHGFKKIAADEELANSTRLSSQAVNEKTGTDENVEEDTDDLRIVPGTEADVTEDDLIILGDKDADQDLGDDELTAKARVDALEEEDDLDIPESGASDDEATGGEDEENNYYSLGGDRHENLEEDSSNVNE